MERDAVGPVLATALLRSHVLSEGFHLPACMYYAPTPTPTPTPQQTGGCRGRVGFSKHVNMGPIWAVHIIFGTWLHTAGTLSGTGLARFCRPAMPLDWLHRVTLAKKHVRGGPGQSRRPMAIGGWVRQERLRKNSHRNKLGDSFVSFRPFVPHYTHVFAPAPRIFPPLRFLLRAPIWTLSVASAQALLLLSDSGGGNGS